MRIPRSCGARCLLGAILVAALACDPGSTGGTAPEVMVVDSAGVPMIQLAAPLSALAGPRLTLDRVGVVGTEGSGTELFRVASARFLPSGALAIGNAGSGEVLIVDPDGQVVRRFGGRGEGPGEFSTITSLHVDEAGQLVVFDDMQGRLTRFDSAGEVSGTRKLTDPSAIADLVPLLGSLEGPVLAVFGDNRSFGRDQVIRQDSTPLLRFSPGSMAPDTLGRWATRAWHFAQVGQGVTRASLAFGPELFTAGRAGRAVLAESHATHVTVLSEQGRPLSVLRWTGSPRPVTESEYEAWAQEREGDLAELPEDLRQALASPPSFGTHPTVAGVGMGSEGDLWIAPTELRTSRTRTWLRIGPLGEARGSLELPGEASLLDASEGRLAILLKDSMGVETVEIHRFEPASR